MMIKLLQLSLATFVAVVFSLHSLTVYDCKKQDTIHIFESCCYKAEIKKTASCCTKKSPKRETAEINDLCCENINITLDKTYNGNFEKTPSVKTNNYYVADFILLHKDLYKSSLKHNSTQRGPPDRIQYSNTNPLFILFSSLLC
jgi:hypothetical protein